MSTHSSYTDLRGRSFFLKELDPEQQSLVAEMESEASQNPDSADFSNRWLARIGTFFEKRGLTRRETTRTTAWRIFQDLTSRLSIAEGWTEPGDYRDELEQIILSRFRTRREFCQATGLSEDLLSHVLAKRKNLSIDTLTDALDKIGYTLHISPRPEVGT